MERQRGLSRSENTIDKIKDILFNKRRSILNFNTNNIFDPLNEAKINKHKNTNIRRRIIKIDDIKKFFMSDIKTVLNKRNRKCSITERDIKNAQKIQQSFGVSNNNTQENVRQSIVDLRASHSNFRSLYKINKLNVPKYLTDPLLIETELLMCEIELDSKNVKEAYEHFKNSILILFIFKQQEDQNDVKGIRYFRKKLRIISVYLREITNYLNDKTKKKKFEVLRQPIKTSRTFMSFHKKRIFKEKFGTKKTSVYLGRNNLFESIHASINASIKTKGEDYYNQLINRKLAAEIEKFFIFLNSLSIYQIKLLNDTQPKREIRNDLPILFNGQFKDTLTTEQRNSLSNLHTMSISRNMILNNPDNLIIPTNLNFSALDYNNSLNNNRKKKSNVIRKTHKITSKMVSLVNTREYEYFKSIIFSKNANKDLQQYFLDNYALVMKILKELRKKEIKYIVNNPDILVEPINNYKKNKSGYLNIINNCLIYYKEIKDLRKLIYELNENNDDEKKENEEENENNNNIDKKTINTNDNLFICDSEYNKSFSLSLNDSNSSFYRCED